MKIRACPYQRHAQRAKARRATGRIRPFAAFGQTNSHHSLAVHVYLEPTPAEALPNNLEALRELGWESRPDLKLAASETVQQLRLQIATEIESAWAALETNRAQAVAIRARPYAEVQYLRDRARDSGGWPPQRFARRYHQIGFPGTEFSGAMVDISAEIDE